MYSQERWEELKTGAVRFTRSRRSTTGRITNTNTALNAEFVNFRLNPSLVKTFAPNVGVRVDHKKYEEASQKRVEAGIASEEHRQKRTKDSYLCYLAYMKMRREERDV